MKKLEKLVKKSVKKLKKEEKRPIWRNVSADGTIVEMPAFDPVCPHCEGGLIQVSGLYKKCEYCFGTALKII